MLALGLLSDDADAPMAVRMVQEQGIKVVGVRFVSPFGRCGPLGCRISEMAGRLGIRLIAVPTGHDYLEVVQEPRFGRGSGMNPCIDCRIYVLRKAKAIAEEMGARFIFTPEVIGQRPADRHQDTLDLIEREAGVEGKVLRPLSAGVLPETEMERTGLIDRDALMRASVRGRRARRSPPKVKDANDIPCRTEGCLLCDRHFAVRLEDHLAHQEGALTLKDVNLLKMGRHFRVNGHKVIVGRDRYENARLSLLASEDHIVMSPVSVPGPVGLLDRDGMESLEIAASMVAHYSDSGGKKVQLKVSSKFGGGLLEAEPMPLTELKRYRLS